MDQCKQIMRLSDKTMFFFFDEMNNLSEMAQCEALVCFRSIIGKSHNT